ncbi:uncharacterized protein CTRU02_203654 [Colletotrichum truncatum]|uniref:Uncharacterized protein n=1 Tax=Colletotrichum truncatum TaxID=5467 RepID=A0ACC3Z9X2_COLTU|nr:uncharacterized protein CTRU02_03987 [Colletotrichum truncatum]KAF6796027.1 hypothetical protein CTRU02_03987 [Colletotrichum truncatum]
MAALRLTSAPSGVRAAAASPLTSQLWSSGATSTTASPQQAPNVPTAPASAAATAAAAIAAAAVTTKPASPPPPPFALARELSKDRELPKRYFNPSDTVLSESSGSPGNKPHNENNANLGKTLRILQEHLPKLLQSPLPQEILAPNISLHLFPTTHPHLPTVSGRVAYTAALWSAPIAWNRLPLVGNVRLSIISERVTKQPLPFAPLRAGALPEQLVVRWCTPGGKSSSSATTAATTDGAATGKGAGDKGFTGLFVFQFDAEGRILSHTIETVQEGGDWEKGVGAKVVGLTDWLLGGMRRGGDSPSPAFEGLNRKD